MCASETKCRHIKCGLVGLVRLENVMRETEIMRLYYCGACDHSWTANDLPVPQAAKA
jgi:hypothetical protein